MIHKTQILSTGLAALVSWATWLVVLYKLSPFTQYQLALPSFYATLFIALATTFSLLFYYLRRAVSKNEIHNMHLNVSMRQGVLISFMLVVGLGFQRLRILTWWDALLLLAIVLMVEFYFMSRT